MSPIRNIQKWRHHGNQELREMSRNPSPNLNLRSDGQSPNLNLHKMPKRNFHANILSTSEPCRFVKQGEENPHASIFTGVDSVLLLVLFKVVLLTFVGWFTRLTDDVSDMCLDNAVIWIDKSSLDMSNVIATNFRQERSLTTLWQTGASRQTGEKERVWKK